MNEMKINFIENNNTSKDCIYNKLQETYSKAIIKANEKANNLEPWTNGASSYLINEFLDQYKNHRKSIFNFGVDQKLYNAYCLISENNMELIFNKYLKDKNKKNAYLYSNTLSKQLFEIIIDYMNYHVNETEDEISIISEDKKFLELEDKQIKFDELKDVSSIFTSRFKNFERDLLINEYSSKKEDIDNDGMRTLIYGSSQLFYVSSNEHFFVMSYSPANEQYYNQKIKDVNKAPNFSFFVYKKEAEDFFVNNFDTMNNLHKNFMQFTYLSDTNQNIVNAMGEASLISQYWYTESVNRILKDHDKELKKSKDSRLLAEYIIKYILAAEIDGVDLIEVYPFDRVFMFNNSIFEPNKNNDIFAVFEGLLESKVPHNEIKNKDFLGGRTQYAFEWEREKTGFDLDRFDPSKKKIKEVYVDSNHFNINETKTWENDYNKDDETVMNNLIVSMLKGDTEYNKTQMLEYKSKYSNEGITYLYSSGTNLKTQIKSLYNLQEYYLKNLPDDDGIDKEAGQILFEEKMDDYFNNAKIVLFSYTPEDERSEKGFTLILVANEDVPKALMELKSEKDDLHTALKLLINQHFTIDQKYKEQSIKEQNELIDILTQTKHSIKNSFENFSYGEDINLLKEKILGIIEQDRVQMMEQGRDALIKSFIQDENVVLSSLNNSLGFLKSLFTTTENNENNNSTFLSKKFQENSTKPWDYFAYQIYNLTLNDLKSNRIHKLNWSDNNNPNIKLDLIIDFNELQNFSCEWKESLFNDAIYVMLKNSCEHSLETLTDDDNHKEIFLDVYISNINNNETLNIEFTNSTGQICKDIYSHINNETTIKNNNKKENSTGIGVVTIRKRLDVTYGLDQANIKFTMVSEDKIKSLLYFPITSLENDSLFLDSSECNNKTNILYLEDNQEYYHHNISFLKENKLNCTHDVRYKESHKYSQFNMFITDLNIFGESSDSDAISNGLFAIKNYVAKNKNGVIIVLSSDINELDNEKFEKYKKVSVENNIPANFEPNHIYLFNIKKLDNKMINLILNYQEEHRNLQTNVEDTNTNANTEEIKRKIVNVFNVNGIYNLKDLKDTIKKEDIDKNIFTIDKKDIKQNISKWLELKVKLNDILGYDDVSNCEIPHMFITKLAIFGDKSILNNFILKHEFEIRNIVIAQKNDPEHMVNISNKSTSFNMQKKGIFGKISHDIFNKMPEFSDYDANKIAELKKLNDKLRNSFSEYFNSYLNNSLNIKIKDIEEEFDIFIQEIEKLKNAAINHKVHLGTDIKNIKMIIDTLYYMKEV